MRLENLLKIKKSIILSILNLGLILNFKTFAANIYVGKVVKSRGRVVVLKKNAFRPISIKRVKGKLFVGDILRTKRKAFAEVKFIDNTKIFLEPETRLIIEDYRKGDKEVYTTYGKVIYKIAKQTHGTFKIKTPTSIIGVKGTELLTFVKDGASIIAVKEGKVEVFNPSVPKVKVLLRENTLTIVKKNSPPLPPVKVDKKVIEKLFKVASNKDKEKISKKENSSSNKKLEETKKTENKNQSNLQKNNSPKENQEKNIKTSQENVQQASTNIVSESNTNIESQETSQNIKMENNNFEEKNTPEITPVENIELTSTVENIVFSSEVENIIDSTTEDIENTVDELITQTEEETKNCIEALLHINSNTINIQINIPQTEVIKK
ncbi:MAG: FecR domain-containing protein [Nanoarchaeota archaeon]